MNIIIYGPRASGKTVLAEALAEYYHKKKQQAVVVTDDKMTDSRAVANMHFRKAMAMLRKTKGSQSHHVIVTTQAFPDIIYGFYETVECPSLYDYKIGVRT